MKGKPFYNVFAVAAGVGRKWVHPSNLSCNGSGGYKSVILSETSNFAPYTAIRWSRYQ